MPIASAKPAKVMKILVCSSSPLKHGATLDAAHWISLDRQTVIGLATVEQIAVEQIAHAPSSGIPNQPLGDAQTLLGALNRAGAGVPEHYVVAIENGVMEREVGFIDLAYVVVVGPRGHVTVRSSKSVQVPRELVETAKALGQETTCGQLEAQRTPGCDHADPHIMWSGGTTNRRKLLANAVEEALRSAIFAEYLQSR
jgi:non-canonical (house-cleaning) NTP pyrophosphatase